MNGNFGTAHRSMERCAYTEVAECHFIRLCSPVVERVQFARRTVSSSSRHGLGVLLALISPPARAQGQTYQTWPEIDTYIHLSQNFRLYFIATQTRESGQGTNAEIGPNIDFFFIPLFRRRRSVISQPDESKSRFFLFRGGYHYLPSTEGPTEQRGVAEMTARYPLRYELLFSDRSRVDLRFISGEFSWRYREIEPYYEHQNDTSQSPNRQLNALGISLNLYF